ncbi:MAG: hypothetical protein HY329_18465, partial [Chloroflexi bacterium]|nr:hypothetical protein [Chloroflexota bacterium]
MEVDPRSSSPFGILDPVARLTSSLVDVFEVESVTRLREGGVKFKGRFTVADTAAAFKTVRSRFEPLG